MKLPTKIIITISSLALVLIAGNVYVDYQIQKVKNTKDAVVKTVTEKAVAAKQATGEAIELNLSKITITANRIKKDINDTINTINTKDFNETKSDLNKTAHAMKYKAIKGFNVWLEKS